jgi:opacity protein-like surface antigen
MLSSLRLPLPARACTALSAAALRRALALAMAATLACLAAPAAAAPDKPVPHQAYSQAGVGFQHPAGWKVTADTAGQEGGSLRSIDLEGPEEAIINLMFMPTLSGQDIETFAARAAQHRAEMDKAQAAQHAADGMAPTPLTTSRITRRVGGKAVKGVQHRFGYTSGGDTVQLEARFYTLDFGKASVIIMTQSFAEDARLMDTALGLAMDTLRYRPGR